MYKIRARVDIKPSKPLDLDMCRIDFFAVSTFALSVFSKVVLAVKKIKKSWHFLSKGYDQKLIHEKALTFGNVRET